MISSSNSTTAGAPGYPGTSVIAISSGVGFVNVSAANTGAAPIASTVSSNHCPTALPANFPICRFIETIITRSPNSPEANCVRSESKNPTYCARFNTALLSSSSAITPARRCNSGYFAAGSVTCLTVNLRL